MYLSHYHLKLEPFSISTDPQFLWLGEKHQEALAALKYGILANKGFLLLTGDVGTGKTTLINALVNNLGDEIHAARVHDPGLEKLDFLNYIAGAFKLKKSFRSKGEFISDFSLFLNLAYDKNKKVLLIIDEAQRLNDDLLEEIRLLSNIEKQHAKLINIFFVGQNEFNEILIKKENRALRQRITLVHTLEALNRKETTAYIGYRLQVAGSDRNIFNLDAIKEIYSFSGGYPRLINVICDHALLTGFVKGKTVIDAQIIRECADELRIPIKSYEKENRKPPPPAEVRNLKEIGNKSKSGFTLRTVFLLLFFLTAAAFYYRHANDLPGVYLDKLWERFTGAGMVAKNESGFQTERIKKPDSNPVTYPIPIEPKRTPQEKIASPPPSGSFPENEMTDKPGSLPIPENSDPPPAIKDGEADKIPDNADAASFKPKSNIYFEYNSFDLPDDALSALDGIAAAMNQNPDLNILIKGYTDHSGKFSYNLKLSERRAAVVKNHLVKNGLNPFKIDAVGMGPDQTAVEQGEERNDRRYRRVEIEFY